MGRLTLNMLLSFAQFEREVTGERIRDKIAASKRRGMWMGGSVPTGYLVKDRKLIVNELQAALVRHIMQRYTELGSVVELVDDLSRNGYRTEAKVSENGRASGGTRFGRGMLYRLLTNPVYRGITVHKGKAHPGEHEAIVSEELWDNVQLVLAERTQGHSRRMKAKEPSLFVGLLVDGEGRAMTPSHSVKRKIREQAQELRAGIVLIEDAASGIQLLQELQREGFARIKAVKPQGDKTMRMAAQTPAIEAGRVYLPTEAAWLPEYLHELAMFPKGKFNDQADSTSQALSFIGAPQPGEAWLETMRQVDLMRHGLRPEDLTITFDHTDQTARFTLDSGRLVQREVDGFYHVTPGEWESVHGMQGVTKINDS